MVPLRIILCMTAVLIMTPAGFGLSAEPLPVFVSILPQQYFVQQIGGDLVTVQALVPPGASPHTYEPRPRQMVDLARARLYFAIGVPFEAVWLGKITAASPAMQVVPTDRGIRKITMAAHDHGDEGETPAGAWDGHDDGPGEGGHAADGPSHGADHAGEGGPDPHIWLSPPLVKLQAGIILEALKGADPSHAAAYELNYRRFAAELDALDRDLKNTFAGRQGLRFMVFHPSWGYFADAYGLEQVPVEIEGKDPKPAQLQSLIAQAREHGIRVIFAQPQFSTRSASLLAKEIGGRVVFADPLAVNWLDNMREVAAQFAASLR